MNIESLTFITGNTAKAEQLARHLEYPVTHQKLDLPEIQSLDLKEIVEHKAKEAYKQIKKPVLVEDTSLTFSVLGKLPGPLIKWFLTELDNAGLCRCWTAIQIEALMQKSVSVCMMGKNCRYSKVKSKAVLPEARRANAVSVGILSSFQEAPQKRGAKCPWRNRKKRLCAGWP